MKVLQLNEFELITLEQHLLDFLYPEEQINEPPAVALFDILTKIEELNGM